MSAPSVPPTTGSVDERGVTRAVLAAADDECATFVEDGAGHRREADLVAVVGDAVDHAGFDRCMEQQRERSREGSLLDVIDESGARVRLKSMTAAWGPSTRPPSETLTS